jgi:hypothetical protein
MVAIILAVSLAAAAPALAWNEPGEFRGVPFGASVEEAKQKVPTLVCVPLMGSCREFFELGSTTVYGFWTFRNGGFDQIDLTFPAGRYPDVKGVFIARFGDPTARRTQVIRPGDPPLENETLEWAGERAHVELRRFHRGTEQGTATIRTRAGLEEAARRRPGASKSE